MARPGLFSPDGLDSVRLKLELRDGGLELFLKLSDLPSLLLAAVFKLTFDVLGLAFLSPNLVLVPIHGLSSLLLPVLRITFAVSEAVFTLEGLGSRILGTLRIVTLDEAGLGSRLEAVEAASLARVMEFDLVTSR